MLRPEDNRPPAPNQRPATTMFAGSLADFDLAQTIGLLHASSQSGELVLWRGEERLGSAYFQVGQLTHAECGRLKGLDGLSQLVTHLDAAFSFDSGVLPVEWSLTAYPTDRLLERVRRQVEDLKLLLAAVPPMDARPLYQPSSGPLKIPLHPPEIGLLVLCNGQRTVAEIAQLAGADPRAAVEAMSKFRQANLITLVESPLPGGPPGLPPPVRVEPTTEPRANFRVPPAAPASATPTPPAKPIRYWRGRPMT